MPELRQAQRPRSGAAQPKITLPRLHTAQLAALRTILRHERTVLVCGRRFGKTTLLEYVAAIGALGGLKVAWFGPDFRRNRPSFDRIGLLLGPALISKSATMLEIRCSGGGEIDFWTMADEGAGRSRSYDLAVLDEVTLAPREITPLFDLAIRPTLIDRGGVVVMAGTPRGVDGEQLFYRAATQPSEGWAVYHAPTTANPTLNADEVARLPTEYAPLVYEQEILANFVDWSGSAFFGSDAWLVDGKPAPYPERCDFIFATIDTAFKTGREHDGTAVVIFGKNRHHDRPLYVLDWDVVQISGELLIEWYPALLRRMRELHEQCGARLDPRGPYIEDTGAGMILLRQAMRQGLPAAAISTKLTALGKDERALSTVNYHMTGKVVLTQPAADKLTRFQGVQRNHFLSQVTGYRPGAEMSHDDLLDCYTYGLSIGLGDGRGW